MSKRHTLNKSEWASVFTRLEELVLANSGEDEFEEIFKIVIAKLYAENKNLEIRGSSVEQGSQELRDNVNEILKQASVRWPGVVEHPAETRLSREHLWVCIDVVNEIPLSEENFEVLDNLFEFLSTKESKGSKGQYFTPRHVIDFCMELIDPKPGETILDPACGSGGFLIHALNYVHARYRVEKSSYARQRLWGFDFGARPSRIAKASMLIAGDGQANIHRLNSLTLPDLVSSADKSAGGDTPGLTVEDVLRARTRNFKGFDIILTNPPFAGEIKQKSLLEGYQLSGGREKIERDVLFLERCVELLKPGGRMAIILPHNKVGGRSWEYLRRWLLSRIQVTAVLGLGRNMFLPHTSQKAAVVFGVKRQRVVRSIPPEEITFLVNEKDGKDSKGRAIEKEGSTLLEPAWQRIDHDLDVLAARVAEQQRAILSG